jgi:hypothetical protein
MKHVEKFIRHLQSSIEKRKAAIFDEHQYLYVMKEAATYHYDEEDSEYYREYTEIIKDSKRILKELHTIQKTETEMLKWLENIRSCHEELLQKDMQLFDFSLEEEQHD